MSVNTGMNLQLDQMKQDSEEKGYDDVSLESLGAHLLFGEVDGETAHAACDFILKSNLFGKKADHLTLFLNTPGGSVGDGFAIVDVMECSSRPVHTVGVGQISSFGVLLLSAGAAGHRTLTDNSEVMAHQFSSYFEGKQHELVAVTKSFVLLEQRMIKHFLKHSTMTEKQIRDVLFAPSDRYLTPKECKKHGLIDRIVGKI